MSIDAVALVRIPEWEPSEEIDVRELEDGSALVFLEVPYDSEDDAILNALDDLLGDALLGQDEQRGVFILPDASEPEDAETYDAVLAAVGDAGRFIALDPEMPPEMQQLMQNPQELLGQMFEAMGIGDPETLMRAMRDGDPEAMKMAQIQMTSAMERAMQPPSQPSPEPKTGEPDGNGKKS